MDFNFWERFAGVPEFPGLKIGPGPLVEHRPDWNVRPVTVRQSQDRLLLNEFGEIGFGGNSGFAGLNLVAQFGPDRIICVGFDMRVDRGVHWHGAHGRGFANPESQNVRRWRRVLDQQAALLEAMVIEVINASPVSALRNYPKMSLQEALACKSKSFGSF